MKKTRMLLMSLLLLIGLMSFALAGDQAKAQFKVGDTVYVCNCGDACHCGSLSQKPAKCTCGEEMAAAKITKVDGDTITVNVNGKEKTLKTDEMYTCACGPNCNCGYMSNKPGKCACGKPLKKMSKSM